MGQTLTNNIYLPDEGERNCYAGLAANWRALDAHLGNTAIHVTYADKQAWNEHVADTVKHVTASDKQAWNEHVADTVKHVTASDKQAWNGHVADTTIHVTSADKQAWNGHIADSVKHVTAEDKAKWDAVTSKADDSDVVHKSGNETIAGNKTFSDSITFSSVNIEDIRWKSLVNQTVDLNDCYIPKAGAISGYYTTDISSGANISNKATNAAFTMISLTTRRVSASDYQVRQVFYGSGAKYIRTCSNGTWSAWINETDKYVTTDTNQTISGNKTFSSINGVEPSSLSLPSGNASDVIDISSYITDLSGNINNYTAPANGWISIAITGTAISIVSSSWSDSRLRESSGNVRMLYPVLKNKALDISVTGTTLAYARFIPCQGNV